MALRKRFPGAESNQRVTSGEKVRADRRHQKRSLAQSPSRPHRAAAQLRFADFLLKRQLGEGTTGKVYLATDIQRGRDVAVTDHALTRIVAQALAPGKSLAGNDITLTATDDAPIINGEVRT